MKASTKIRIWSAAAVLAVGTLVGGAVIAKSVSGFQFRCSDSCTRTAPASPRAPLSSSYAPVIKGVLPEVVSVSSSKMVHPHRVACEPFSNDPFFQQFFGDQAPRLQNSHSPNANRVWDQA